MRSPLWSGFIWLAPLVRPFAFRLCPQFVTSRVLLGASSTPALRALLAEALSTVRPGVLAHRFRALLRVDVLNELQACPVPVLYIRASHDLVVPAHNVARITAALPGVQVTHIQRRFKPLLVRMVSGTLYRIENPESIVGRRSVAFLLPDGAIEVVALEFVETIRPIHGNGAGRAPGGRKRRRA